MATPTAADKASARAMLEDGTALLKKGDYTEALRLFFGADALVSLPSTKLAMARAQVMLGQLVEAEDALLAALRMPGASDEASALRQARADAAQLLDRTKPRIPELTIVVSGRAASTATLRVDGVVIPKEAWVAPRRLNPGTHHVELQVASAEAPIKERIEVAEAEKKTLRLDAGSQEAPAPSPHAAPESTPQSAEEGTQ